MSDDPPDEDLLTRVDLLPPVSLSGLFFRHTSKNRDPLSGAGARLSGGRWNPRGLFPALYLATPVDGCMSELDRMARNQGVTVEDLLVAGRVLHEIEARDVQLLDLRSPDALDAVGLEQSDIVDESWEACQRIGHAAWFLGRHGLAAPSAGGVGDVVVLFEHHVPIDALQVRGSHLLTIDEYEALR